MEVFEIHITGDESILEKAKRLKLKTIAVELLRPDKSVIRTEYMTSHIQKFRNYDCCLEYVQDVVEMLKEDKVSVVRFKIESPYYEHYKEQSLYMEAHFETISNNYALSRNTKKSTFLGTVREYDKKYYDQFRKIYAASEVEICLYDNNVQEDYDWIRLFPSKNRDA